MPELPEVETVARGVHERVRGETIESVWFSSKPEPFKTSPRKMARALTGKKIERVYRVGKHIVFDLSKDTQWTVHLGMTGRLPNNVSLLSVYSTTPPIFHRNIRVPSEATSTRPCRIR